MRERGREREGREGGGGGGGGEKEEGESGSYTQIELCRRIGDGHP